MTLFFLLLKCGRAAAAEQSVTILIQNIKINFCFHQDNNNKPPFWLLQAKWHSISSPVAQYTKCPNKPTCRSKQSLAPNALFVETCI